MKKKSIAGIVIVELECKMSNLLFADDNTTGGIGSIIESKITPDLIRWGLENGSI